MDTIKIDKKLKRINTVYESFKEDGKISPLEKDLLLGYIRELYDYVSEIEVHTSGEIKKITNIPVHEVPVTKPATEPIVVAPVQQTIKTSEPEQTQPAEAVKINIPEPMPAVKKEEPELQHIVPKVEIQEPIQTKTEEVASVPTDLKAIFTIVKARDISERLAMSPIADIAKAMSINDKMLILKELFGNDSTLFNESITKLNGFTSFEEAKSYLINNIAVKYHWAQEERAEKAEAFVKLVSRRYS